MAGNVYKRISRRNWALLQHLLYVLSRVIHEGADHLAVSLPLSQRRPGGLERNRRGGGRCLRLGGHEHYSTSVGLFRSLEGIQTLKKVVCISAPYPPQMNLLPLEILPLHLTLPRSSEYRSMITQSTDRSTVALQITDASMVHKQHSRTMRHGRQNKAVMVPYIFKLPP